jgi:membrane protein DedA with SNARE-associated domain
MGVAVARTTPGVRIVAIAAAAIAALPFLRFVAGLSAGNAVFVGGHFGLGFALGPAAGELAGRVGGLGVVVVASMMVLAVVGWLGWRAIRSRRARSEALVAGDWSDASCPACLLLGAVAARVAPVEAPPLAIR